MDTVGENGHAPTEPEAVAVDAAAASPSGVSVAAGPAHAEAKADPSPIPATDGSGGSEHSAAASSVVNGSVGGPPEAESKVAPTAEAASTPVDPQEALEAEQRRKALSKLMSVDGNHDGVELAWNDISLSIGGKRILRNLSGVVSPGSLMCIMGPSGAGKSSLLNVLAGIVRDGGANDLSGSVTANGVTIDPSKFRNHIAYVMQEDLLYPTQTPREALHLSAALRLPKTTTIAERTLIVENIIQALGLSKCADTLIGNNIIPGISGGEKKRTAIGIELVSSPDILFLDEPTSGLDSFAASKVVQILQDLAKSGRTVVTTIHQPSTEVFARFADVLLLANGRLVYHAPVADVLPHFEATGRRIVDAGVKGVDPGMFVCRDNYNPADFIVFLLQQQTQRTLAALADDWSRSHPSTKRADSGINSSSSQLARQRFEKLMNSEKPRPGFMTQFWWLGKRDFLNLLRDKRAMRGRIGISCFLGLLVSAIFWKAASYEDVDANSVQSVISTVQSHFGVTFQLGIMGMFILAQATMLTFPLERPVFIREYAAGSYGSPAYFMSKLFTEIPVTICQSALMVVIMFWCVQFNSGFFQMTFTIALLGLVSSSLSLVLGAAASSAEAAMQMMPLALVPQMLFAGFFVPVEDIPAWLRWAQYLCGLKYSLNLLTVVEFENIPESWPDEFAADTFRYEEAVFGCSGADLVDGECSASARATKTYDAALFPRNDVSLNDVGLYAGILVGMLVSLRLLALVILSAKARPSSGSSGGSKKAKANAADADDAEVFGRAPAAAPVSATAAAPAVGGDVELATMGVPTGDDDDDLPDQRQQSEERVRSMSMLHAGSTKSKRGVEVSWDRIGLNIGGNQILTDCSGTIKPGRLTCVMGPSGAGKSSLLNILAGRTSSSGSTKVTGKFRVNGKEVDPVKFRSRIAYVMQEDTLYATQTPREALHFSAALRLPKTTTAAERTQLVENIISSLGLTKCADTPIGNHLVPGISGGEKKRTAIGIELVSSPDVLVLDECTTGLDSFAAYQVVQILRDLAASGRTVVTTIHQPSSEVFEHFSDVVLLANGRMVYQGPIDHMNAHFSSLGQALLDDGVPDVDPAAFVCRSNYNPADFVLFLLQRRTPAVAAAMADKWQSSADALVSDARTAKYDAVVPPVSHAGFWREFLLLGVREIKNIFRDKRALKGRIGSTVMLNLVVAFVFYQAADWSDVDGSNVPDVIKKVNSQFGILVQLVIGAMMGMAQPVVLAFPLERPVFIREYANGVYGVSSYFLSKMLAEIPVYLCQTCLIYFVVYWLTGLEGNFFAMVATTAFFGFVGASTSLLLSSLASTVQVAMQLMPLAFVPQLLFAGFFIPISNIPVFLRWAQYLCSLKYALNIMMLLEFDQKPDSWPSQYDAQFANYQNAVYGCSGADLVDGECVASAQTGATYETALLVRNEVETDDTVLYLGMLAGMMVLFRFLALATLVVKAKAR